MCRKEAYFAKCTALYNPPAVTDAEKNKYFYEKFDINATFGDVSHNKNISNMDIYTSITTEVMCQNLPSNEFHGKYGKFTLISSSNLQEAYKYSQYGNVGNVLDLLHPPCSEMTMISSIDSMTGSLLELKFQYRNDKYWEIKNTRGFGMTSLWSDVGGFVGIFLGFSLFQLADILLNKVFTLIDEMKSNTN